MDIVVCIKQVPASSNVKIDPNTGVLIRDGNNSKMNPYDLFALEMALRIKESAGATVKTISMGPQSAASIIEESLWMGCDDGIILSDRKFAGSDVVSTAYTISQGIKKFTNVDLIICGKQTTDGDTAQVGPEIAEYLQIPHISYVEEIVEVKEDSIVVKSNMDKTLETYEVHYPCLITIDANCVTPRLPSYKKSVSVRGKKIPALTFFDLDDQDDTHYGLRGSATQVERIFPPVRNTNKVLLRGNSNEKVEQLVNILKDNKFIR